MKIDIFAHILPQKFLDTLIKKAPPGFYLEDLIRATPTLSDLDIRFQIMDKYGDLRQILTLGQPPVELICGPEDAAELAMIGNDEIMPVCFDKIKSTRGHILIGGLGIEIDSPSLEQDLHA